MPQQIIALGGGGFSDEPDNLALERYILAHARRATPAVCFLPTAAGDTPDYIVRFYAAFTGLDCRPTHLSLFAPPTADVAGFLLAQDGLGVLPGSLSPHYDGEVARRPTFQRFVASGEMAPGYGVDNSAALHFVDGALWKTVASRPGATAYWVERAGDRAVETRLEAELLS